jgi:hypothetical protein
VGDGGCWGVVELGLLMAVEDWFGAGVDEESFLFFDGDSCVRLVVTVELLGSMDSGAGTSLRLP